MVERGLLELEHVGELALLVALELEVVHALVLDVAGHARRLAEAAITTV